MEHLVIMNCPLILPRECVAALTMLGKPGTSSVNHAQLQGQVTICLHFLEQFIFK